MKTLTIAAALLLGCAAAAAAQDGPTPTLDEVTLSGDAAKRALTDNEINVATARKLVEACLAYAATKGANGATVVVLNDSGFIVYAYRADGQRPNNMDSAHEKAKTALYLRQPTRLTFSRWHEPEEQLARRTLDMYIVPGGFPLIVADTLIGSIGVGGASGGDEQCAYEAVRRVMGKQPANWAPPAAP